MKSHIASGLLLLISLVISGASCYFDVQQRFHNSSDSLLNISMRAGNILIVLGIIASWIEYRIGDDVTDAFKSETSIAASPNSKQNGWFFVGITMSIIGAVFAGFGDSAAEFLANVFSCAS